MQIQKEQIVAVIGAGPAGLMAAEQLAECGFEVHVYDAMPSAGRKFLLAGKSGMNLSHAEDFTQFKQRYRERSEVLEECLQKFDANQIRAWAKNLGIETFVGTSGRIFPIDMKAAPLLRAWLHRLKANGVRFHMRHRWLGVDMDTHQFETPSGLIAIKFDAVVFALGGASWKRLGSDGTWIKEFAAQKIRVQDFQPSNCGFVANWSSFFQAKFAGAPLTNVSLSLDLGNNRSPSKLGQFVITERGVEGSLIYAYSADIREKIRTNEYADILIDLLPAKSPARVFEELTMPRGSRSLSSHLRSKLGLHPVHCALLYEILDPEILKDEIKLAACIKELPIRLLAPFPIDEAISSAGGIDFSELDSNYMITAKPGWFCAGEMLDWEVPTGGYLLSACFATGVAAGRGLVNWLQRQSADVSRSSNEGIK